MSEGNNAPELMREVEAVWAHLRGILAGRDDALLAARPPSGKWSVTENVRHMLFAEQAHLGMFIAGGPKWSPAGYTPRAMLDAKRLQMDANAPTLAEVLEAWQAIHSTTRAAIGELDTEGVRRQVHGHLKHQRQHLLAIERLLRKADRGALASQP